MPFLLPWQSFPLVRWTTAPWADEFSQCCNKLRWVQISLLWWMRAGRPSTPTLFHSILHKATSTTTAQDTKPINASSCVRFNAITCPVSLNFSITWTKYSVSIAYSSLVCVSILFHWKLILNMFGGGGGDGVYPSILISCYRLCEMATTEFLCATKFFLSGNRVFPQRLSRTAYWQWS